MLILVYPRAFIRLSTTTTKKASFSSVIGPKDWKPQNSTKCILGNEPARTDSSELWSELPQHVNRKRKQYFTLFTKEKKQLQMTKLFSSKTSSVYVFSEMHHHTERGVDWSSLGAPIFSSGMFILLLRSSKCYLGEVNSDLSNWTC